MKHKLKMLFVIGALAGINLVKAEENTLITITVREGQIAGVIPDGTRLASARISNPETLSRFRVWLGSASTVHDGVYLVPGMRWNTENELRVRLEGSGWEQKDGALESSEDSRVMTFDIVTDGYQTLRADKWSLEVSGFAFLTDS